MLGQEDQDFLNRFNNCDEEVIADIYNKISFLIITILRRRLEIDKDTAMGILHDIFLMLCKKQGTITITTSLSAYIKKMMDNKINDILHKKSVVAKALEILRNDLKDSFQPSHHRQLELYDLLRHAINCISAQRCRQASILRFIKGYEIAEIAVEMGITEQAVSNLLSKARPIIAPYFDRQ